LQLALSYLDHLELAGEACHAVEDDQKIWTLL
jgi:hypothetical protein